MAGIVICQKSSSNCIPYLDYVAEVAAVIIPIYYFGYSIFGRYNIKGDKVLKAVYNGVKYPIMNFCKAPLKSTTGELLLLAMEVVSFGRLGYSHNYCKETIIKKKTYNLHVEELDHTFFADFPEKMDIKDVQEFIDHICPDFGYGRCSIVKATSTDADVEL